MPLQLHPMTTDTCRSLGRLGRDSHWTLQYQKTRGGEPLTVQDQIAAQSVEFQASLGYLRPGLPETQF